MRAFQVLNALAERYDVSLLTRGDLNSQKLEGQQARTRDACRSVTILPAGGRRLGALWRRGLRRVYPNAYYAIYRQPSDWCFISAADRQVLARAYADEKFDLIHLHRLYMLPILSNIPAHLSCVPAQIDMDDVESRTRERLARLAKLNGDIRLARLMAHDAELYRSLEIHQLSRFVRAFVCATGDRQLLSSKINKPPIVVIPNTVAIPQTRSSSEYRASSSFIFLFVGSIGYYPNLDAVAFFCREIAPVLRRRATIPFEIRAVASGRTRQWSKVPQIPELVRCDPSEYGLAAEYAKADAVVAPIRAGGGTRIKILEAFAHKRPVVATSIGAEGLGVRADEHILIADTAEAFAAQCLRLMQDFRLRGDISERAFELVSTYHGSEALRQCFDAGEGHEDEEPTKSCTRNVGACRDEAPVTSTGH